MARGKVAALTREHLEAYFKRRFAADSLDAVDPLKESSDESDKEYGYGRPLRVTFTTAGEQKQVTVRTMTADPFGHNRRSDRIAQMTFCYDAFALLPRHIRPLDVGLFDDTGQMQSIPHGEPFLVTEFVEGTLYAADLKTMQGRGQPTELDRARAAALAEYLVALHQQPADELAYGRAVRDTVGSGEGIFGLCDAYQPNDKIAPPERLCQLEQKAVAWRWRLKQQARPARRTHGDFHPFNLLFRESTDFSVLDCSRGAAGEPADDLTALSINYLFFGLNEKAAAEPLTIHHAHKVCWKTFWQRYLQKSGDSAVLECVAPFFAWRALVLACPQWYPGLSARLRDALLTFAERLLDGAPFDPEQPDQLFTNS